MPHPLVDQLRFTRSEWLRGLEGVSEEAAARHLGTMNCIGWLVGHLAWHEHRYWLERAQGRVLFPQLNGSYGYGAPMSTPALQETRPLWEAVTAAVDPYLDTLTSESLQDPLPRVGQGASQSVGSALRRMTYHYWFHLGEILAIRQVLGQTDLPEYVGDIEAQAPYRPE